ncbi:MULTISPECIES: acyl carrier protein [unclassified Streptomyces]|uniref:acyl carrier protein n=1 Tax=unclassified Streptomyces TaxID=2593676 RepID=UPI002E208E45|nr:acyl carrier protein [Streptomyces sp. NBC_01023]
MSACTLDELKTMLQEAAGVDESVDLDGAVLDTPFSSLGYDSLAMLELATRIQNQLSVPIPDDHIEFMTTPRAVLEYIDGHLPTGA